MNPRTRILIVDDEPDMVRSLRRILRMKGYEVATAESGEEAVDAARKFAPDGVLMDIRMPGIDGIEAYRRIRLDCPDSFVCFMTAHSEAAGRAENEGNRVLTKPVDVDELCRLVASQSADRPILIVDDDPQFSASLKRVLNKEGFQIEVAHGCDEAIELYSQRPHAIVLLDLQLGVLSGWDLLPTLQRLNPDVCVITISGRSNIGRPESADESIAFMPKPLNLEQLISTLHESIEET